MRVQCGSNVGSLRAAECRGSGQDILSAGITDRITANTNVSCAFSLLPVLPIPPILPFLPFFRAILVRHLCICPVRKVLQPPA
jgi:hypothetical protein